jgi:hypothetical protein
VISSPMAGTQKWILSQSHNVVSSVILKIAMNIRLSNIDREFFKKALAKRMVGRTGVLSQSSRALSAMSAQEMDDIADIARDQLREHLRGYESRSDKGK